MAGHTRLRRLDNIWLEPAIFFVTICIDGRRSLLANPNAFGILRDEFLCAPERHAWSVGRFVIMPDHVHFFCVCHGTTKASSLSNFVGRMKQWTAKAIARETGCTTPVWQKQFFDHLLRSHESYESKWRYVEQNPVRARLVERAEDWPFGGEIEILT